MSASLPLVAAFFLSGASGLVYEVVWARQLAVLVGGTAHAAQAVLATFFAGLAAGAFLLGPAAARAANGRRFYARLELGIAGAGALSGVLLAIAPSLAARLTDGSDGARTAAVALGMTLVICLPATLLMGATFPALTRAIAHGFPGAPAETLLGRAYAANTVGAVMGSLVGAFALLPALGVRGTLAAAVLGNVAAAALALVGGARADEPPAPTRATPPMPGSLAAALLLSGFAAISLEIVALRVLAVTLLDTVYTFALAIAAYILGASATARVLGRREAAATPVSSRTMFVAAAAAALWLPALGLAASVHGLVSTDGAGFIGVVAAEAFLALVVAAPAAVPTTWVFLRLAAHPQVGGAALGAGRATAWNGIGCMAAPLVSALVIMPWAGTTGVGVAAVLALVAAALAVARAQPGRASGGALVLVVAAGLAVVVVRGGVHGWVATPGWNLIWKKEGASVAVSVEESPEGLRRLRTNNNFTEGGDAGGLSQIRQGLLPALLVPHATRALALGVGSGITLAGTVAGAPDARIDAVELIPEIGRAVGFFAHANGGVGKLRNVALHVADARTFTAHAAARGARYDLVVGELFHASQAGTGALYAAEHFANVRRLLANGGVYCQWIPLHEAPPAEVKAVVRTFFRVFPHGAAFFGSWTMRTPILGLIGSAQPLQLGWDPFQRAVAAPPSRRARAEASELSRVPETMAAFIGDAATMRRWAGDGPLNSDDRPTLELGAPRGVGRPLGPENVGALVSAWGPPDSLVRYGTAERRAEVVRLQTALFAFFRGNQAWLAGELDRAEQELLLAHGTARELRFIEPALRGLAATWRAMGNQERATSLERALK